MTFEKGRSVKTSRRYEIEKLESREYLSVTATVTTDGDLVVEGQAVGPVEIRAIEQDKFVVTDNGDVVATLEGVNDDIHIRLDTVDTVANTVIVDLTEVLTGQAVDRVFVELGNGDNTFELRGGTVRGMLRYLGGAGVDKLTIADTTIEGPVVAQLRSGNDSIVIAGQLQRQLLVFAGSGDDVVEMTEDCGVEGNVYLELGDGQNRATVAGEIGGHLFCYGGAGDDSVELLALVERGVNIALGDGANTLDLAGILLGNVQYYGGNGSDVVTIASDAAVAGDVSLCLGTGTNSVDHSGAIAGDLRVSSASAGDIVTTAAGTVGGATELNLGQIAPPEHAHGHGRSNRARLQPGACRTNRM
jgi:hypothetical protein